MSKKVDFDGSWQNYLMRNGKFSCGFNMPEALSGKNSYGLPPYAKRMSFLVDDYPSCPEEWMRGDNDKLKSYFVAVQENMGMWLDFNGCADHDHDVAIVISVQGINPITGLPCNDPQLEQYVNKCPKHDTEFGEDRHCEECGHNWPKQNYITTTATPDGQLWIDGFKSAEGIVRQYILTEEKMKGVASNIIGEDRVFAIGLSFFISKKPKRVRLDKKRKEQERLAEERRKEYEKRRKEYEKEAEARRKEFAKSQEKEQKKRDRIDKQLVKRYGPDNIRFIVSDIIPEENTSSAKIGKHWDSKTKFKVNNQGILEEDSSGKSIDGLKGEGYNVTRIVKTADYEDGKLSNNGYLFAGQLQQDINSPDLIMGDWDRDANAYGAIQPVFGQPSFFSPCHTSVNWQSTSSNSSTSSVALDSLQRGGGLVELYHCVESTPVKNTKKLEVGAGAKITQDIYSDPFDLDYWKDEPEAIICVNYCVEKIAKQIIEANGDVEVKTEIKEGFLQDVPVGN
jgi:hypothetical protein